MLVVFLVWEYNYNYLTETRGSKKNKKKNKRGKAKANDALENVNQNHDDKVRIGLLLYF